MQGSRTVTINTAPVINRHPDTTVQTVVQGYPFSTLSVSVSGSAPLSYQWYSNTEPDTVGGTLIVGATNSNFTPPNNTSLFAARYYFCVIRNVCGNVVSDVSGPHIVISDDGCNNNTLGWGGSLGTVSFATNQEWTIGNQVWSDAVQATNCDKTIFDGGNTVWNIFYADCRSNPDYPGDLFSWCAVARFQEELCPYPWRVPVRQDFIDLDIALGGNGSIQTNSILRDRYLNIWGGTYGGNSFGSVLNFQGWLGGYWSQSQDNDPNQGVNLSFWSSGSIWVDNGEIKNLGFTLRCVRDTESPIIPIPISCNRNIPGWGGSLGTVSFAPQSWTVGNREWIIGNQVWSDVVTATNCQKTSFDGGYVGNLDLLNNFNADCRSNPDYPGDLFSWCAVARFANELCPPPWRVPTTQDFIYLDFTMGGNGDNRNRQTVNGHTWQTQLDWYTGSGANQWGSTYGGNCLENGTLRDQGFHANFWTLQEHVDNGVGLHLSSAGSINLQRLTLKNNGKALRCVRDIVPPPPPFPTGCSSNVPGWGVSLGTMSFATIREWTVGDQVWSDVVRATNCNKTTFVGGSINSFNADCRSVPGENYHLFSWCAVTHFQNQLCPTPWRVPTAEDFRTLHLQLGGNDVGIGSADWWNPAVLNRYQIDWGRSNNRNANGNTGELSASFGTTDFWSQSEFNATEGLHLNINLPQSLKLLMET
jgi:uncharacterized protein (TIGR02145 family)